MKLSWYDVHANTVQLFNKIKDSGFAPTAILGIATGGLVPAIILGKLFKCSVISHGIRTYTDENKREYPHVYQDGVRELASFHHTSILIVDDLSDTGRTFQEVLSTIKFSKYIYSQNPTLQFRTAALYTKEGTKHVPDFYIDEISKDTWITFPWE
jgi:hypoxanthine phosphoribosyltransferase